MEQDRLRELMDKYWLAETNEEEEAELKAHFSTHSEDNRLAPLFNHFIDEKNLSVGDDFDKKFLSVIKKRPLLQAWLNPLFKAAAAIIIALSIVYVFKTDLSGNAIALKDPDTYDDPQKAYQETKKALLMISQNLNAGNSYVNEIRKINKAEELIHTNENKR